MKVQALTANYNSSATLNVMLLSSTHENSIPVLLVDDGSDDGSHTIAESFPLVTVFRQTNAGPSVARNRAILESRAEFVLFLDSDDLLRSGYREAFELALRAHPNTDVFVCGMEIVDEDGLQLGFRDALSLLPTPYLSVLRESVPTNGIIVRRSIFSKVGIFASDMRYAEDWDLWLRLAEATDRWVRIPNNLAVYRLRSGSLSKSGEQMWVGIRTVLKRGWRRSRLRLASRMLVFTKVYFAGARYSWAMGLSTPIRRALSVGDWHMAVSVIARNPIFLPMLAKDGLTWLRRCHQRSAFRWR